MNIANFIKDTPTYVWILLIFLIWRGIKALFDRQMRLERLFILPLIFLIWAVYSVIHETYFADISLLIMLIGLIVGVLIGYKIGQLQSRLSNGTKENFVIRHGSPLTLIMVLIIFIVKFILTALIFIYPKIYYLLTYNLLFGVLSGILDGIFWGITLNLFISWYKKERLITKKDKT